MAWSERGGIWTGPRNPEVDLVLPGLDRGTGRDRDRFRASAGTRDRETFTRREMMVKDLHGRLLFDVLRAVVDREVSLADVEGTYRTKGEAGLAALSASAKAKRLSFLAGVYLRQLEGGPREQADVHIVRFLECMGPTASTEDVTASRINAFLAGLTTQRKTPMPATPATRNRYRASIQAMCSWLVREGHKGSSPFFVQKAVKLYEERGGGRLPEMEPDELETYLANAEQIENAAYRLLFWAHIETGADAGELHDALTVRHVRFPAEPTGLTRLRFIRTKTEGRGAVERLVPVTTAFAAALKAHIEAYALERDALVFGMTSYTRAYDVHTQAIKPLPINRKDLRHIAAIRWRRAGADLERIREWLGHTKIEQTRIYAAFRPDDDFDAPVMQRMAAVYTTT